MKCWGAARMSTAGPRSPLAMGMASDITSPVRTEAIPRNVAAASIRFAAPRSSSLPQGLFKRLQARNGAPENQCMHIVSALIGVHGFQIAQVPHDVILVGDAVAAVDIAGIARNRQRFAAIVALDQANRFGG